MPRARAREEEEHRTDRNRGQRDHDGCRAREEAEGDARVLDVVNRERPDEADSRVDREMAADDVFRQLVRADRSRSDEPEADPLCTLRGERSLGDGDRPERVGAGGRCRQCPFQ